MKQPSDASPIEQIRQGRKERQRKERMNEEKAPENPAHEEQIKELYQKQKHILDLFLKKGAISQAQHDKSLKDMTEKMGLKE